MFITLFDPSSMIPFTPVRDPQVAPSMDVDLSLPRSRLWRLIKCFKFLETPCMLQALGASTVRIVALLRLPVTRLISLNSWSIVWGTGAQFLVRGLLDHCEGHVISYGLRDQTLSSLRCRRLRAGDKDLRGLGLPASLSISG